MVSAAYEHIVAILVVGVIFTGTVVALPATIYSNLETINQQQLRNTALNIFDSILLDVGSPSNWGSILDDGGIFDPALVEKFGLAYADPFSKYVLDSDKVQRLSTGLSYERVCELLNIQGDYGFQLSIYRPFKVESNLKITGNEINFSVTVTRAEDGTPIPNAEVKVTAMVTAAYAPGGDHKKNPPPDVDVFISAPIPPVYGTTDVKGIYEDILLFEDHTDYSVESAVAIMEITVAGMSTTVVAQDVNSFAKYINMTTYGDTVLLSIDENFPDRSQPNERTIVDAQAYDSKYLLDLLDDPQKLTWGQGYENATIDFPGIRTINPTVLLMVMEIKLSADPGAEHGGKKWILIAGPFGFAGSEKVFEFGGDETAKSPITMLRRLVVISDMTYIATLSFWGE